MDSLWRKGGRAQEEVDRAEEEMRPVCSFCTQLVVRYGTVPWFSDPPPVWRWSRDLH